MKSDKVKLFIYIQDGIFGESNMAKIVRSVPEKWWKTPEGEVGEDHIIFDVDQEKGTTTPSKVYCNIVIYILRKFLFNSL